MKKLFRDTMFLFLTSLLLVSLDVQAQSIFTNPILGTNPNTDNPYTIGQTVDPNLTVSGIGRGYGIDGTNANNRYNANSWDTVTLDFTAYFEFTLTPNPGYQINFVSFVYTGQASDTGPTSFAFRSSLDGFSANIGSPSATGTTIDLSAPAYQSITTPITFRFYGWGTSNSGGTFSINDFAFNGTVVAAPVLAPVITSDLFASGMLTQSFNYAIVASNFPTSFQATGLPPGLGVNTSTGVISGIPTVTGTYNVTIQAQNGQGSDSQTLVITVTDPGPEINVRGATGGTNSIASGSVNPNSFNNTLFASVNIGGSQTKDYTIQNLGLNDLFLTGSPRVQITGIHASDFSVTLQPALGIIAPGGQTVFEITFTPTTHGVKTAVVSISNNDADENPYTFTIRGNGVGPEITFFGNGFSIPLNSTNPDEINFTDFGNVNVTSTTKTHQFYIVNTGGLSLSLSSWTISGAHASDFAISTSPAALVTSGNFTVIAVTFDPTALGVREAMLSINTNDPGKSTFTFAISGIGVDFESCGLTAFSNIRTQNFETTGSDWGYSVELSSNALPPVIGGGQAYGVDSSTLSNMFVGSNSIQIRGPFPFSASKVSLSMNPVNTSEYNEVRFSMKIGAYTSSTTQGLDAPDQVNVFFSVDGGLTWSHEALVRGSSNAVWDINTSTGTFSSTFKGIDIPYLLPAGFGSVNTGVRQLTLNNLPIVEDLRIRIDVIVDRNDEIWVLDDIIMSGKRPQEAVWSGSAWVGGVQPNASRKVVFNGVFSTADEGSVSSCECQINTGSQVTVAPNQYLLSSGKIVNNGLLVIENNGSVVQKDDYAVNSGTGSTTVRRTAQIRRQDYVYWSSPVENFPVLSISPGTPASVVWKWIPTIGGNFGNWVNANENMIPGKGYIVRGPSSFTNTAAQPYTADFSGRLHNGIIQTSVERGNYQEAGYPSPTNPAVMVTNTDDNMNLIGNPYPSAIRAIDFLNANPQLEGAVRIWTHGSLPSTANPDPFYNNFVYNYAPTDYIIYNSSGASTGPLMYNGFIPSGQGFFVVKQDGPAATSQVVFNNKMRSASYDNSQFFRMLQPEADDSLRPFRIWMDLIPASGAPYRTLVAYVEGATNEQDRLYDAALTHGGFALFSVQDQHRLSIQGRALPFEFTDQVPLGYRTLSSGNYTIAIAHLEGLPEGMEVLVLDTQTGIEHALHTSPYTFYTTAGEFQNRLVLKYQQQTLSLPGITETSNAVLAMSVPGQIAVKSISTPIKAVDVFDLTGRRLLQTTLLNVQDAQLPLSNLRQGLLVRVTLSDGRVYHQKLIH